jgi:hypothetical protein
VPRVPRVGGEFSNANACVLLGVVYVISDVPRVPRVGGEFANASACVLLGVVYVISD